jgi:hypothetical protein
VYKSNRDPKSLACLNASSARTRFHDANAVSPTCFHLDSMLDSSVRSGDFETMYFPRVGKLRPVYQVVKQVRNVVRGRWILRVLYPCILMLAISFNLDTLSF